MFCNAVTILSWRFEIECLMDDANGGRFDAGEKRDGAHMVGLELVLQNFVSEMKGHYKDAGLDG